MSLRLLNAVLGAWLFASGSGWMTVSRFHRVNALVVGSLAVVVAIAGVSGVRHARYANAALGAWLILSVVVTPWPGSLTFWNHLVVGFLLTLFGLAARPRELRRA
jgi:hypothetical protein